MVLTSINIHSCKKIPREPSVETRSVSEVTARGAIVTGNLVDLGEGVNDHGHCWDIYSNTTITDAHTSLGATSSKGIYTSVLTDLEPGKTYYVKAYLQSGSKVYYGSEISFTTNPEDPVLMTTSPFSITTTSAVTGGNISYDGGSSITARGVCWSTSSNPTIASSKTSDGTGTGSFTSNITGLAGNTTYFVRAYATNNNNVSTAYGNQVSFTTLPVTLSTLSTNTITSITSTTAVSGGSISSDGGGAVTERGVCWSTSENPTILSNRTINGTGTGSFTSNLSGLSDGTTYYVRAYATNSAGTAYGGQLIFITPVTDVEGNVYKTVKIGAQVWMAENLKSTKYNDGSSIPNVTDDTEWTNLTSSAYCWYNNNGVTYRNIYGALYNWYAVNTGKLCPVGWRVPGDSEWSMLTALAGGESVAGGKLKETGTTHWNSPNTGASDDFGFTALPGGYHSFQGGFDGIGVYGDFWSSTEYNINNSWARDLGAAFANVYRANYSKKNGFSVRCIKN